ncbi:TPA: N-acylglucosamine 2-epimerase, partial [Vibrio vulnificus]|nr:N-acylglucosamine 2-epimerase [Vibrio vulnificus]HAS6102081.1 N-acylglucosamine 2-epimerase [Vibrio vulnificus]HAS6113720.1 N-acylglucosamine 2-epimerase [Vibrio vulnificus]HAS6124737.1 N-acylglucosamine 2-epimerase [Vibrio vulnificus]HAS6129023.1 N-acylglucosamine 2-epimerase [Vibrio vulnificus]
MIKNKVLSKVSFALCLVVNSSNVYADSQPLSLPSGEEWLTHAAQGLAPYWMMESAQGVPVGNFPTFRCDDGSVL